MEVNLCFCELSRKLALRTTGVYVENFATRLLPLFDHIEEEASAETERARDSAMSSPAADEIFDSEKFAEAVREYGLKVYENLQFTRQQLLGLASAGLYHLWERLLKQFLLKELRGWTFDGRDVREIVVQADFRWLETFLSKFGFHLTEQCYYPDLNQLRLVANVVKHGDGKSCDDLQKSAPWLFEGHIYHFDIFSKADSLELKPADFTRYARAVSTFWNTLPESLTSVEAG
jgi:hypothetical protein